MCNIQYNFDMPGEGKGNKNIKSQVKLSTTKYKEVVKHVYD